MVLGQSSELQNKTSTLADETPKGKGAPSAIKEPTPEEKPKTHTEEQVERLVQLAKMETGRGNKAVEAERDTLKLQLTHMTSERDDIQTERGTLEKRIEEMSSSDPELNNLEKRAKELRNQDRQLKDGRRVLETDRQTNASRVKKAEDFEREVFSQVIVEEYEDGDLTKLKSFCDTFEATSEEQIRKVAATLWAKKGVPPVVPYSGVTSGGGIDFSKLTPSEKTKVSLDKLRKK